MNFLLAFFITSFSAIVVYSLYKLQSVADRLDGFQKEIDSLDRDIGYLSKSFRESINLFPTTFEEIEKDQELSDKAPLDNFYKVSIIPGSSIEKELDYYIGCIKSKCRGKYIRRIDLPVVTNKIVSSKAVSNAE